MTTDLSRQSEIGDCTRRTVWDHADATYPRVRVVTHRTFSHPYKIAVSGTSMLAPSEARDVALALLAAAVEVEDADA